MKRFYKAATTEPVEGGFAILLDGKTINTPQRNALVVPREALAKAIAAEWNGQGEELNLATMRLTGLSNAAIDIVRADREAFADTLAKYGESDLLCYRADGPEELVERQSRVWDPLLIRVEDELGIVFERVTGIMHKPQPETTIEVLRRVTCKQDAFTLAAMSPLVTITGSLILGLLLADNALERDFGWSAAHIDADWQEEQWGTDAEAVATRANARADYDAAIDLVELLWIDSDLG